MIKKPVRKIQLVQETLRIISNEQLPKVVGGMTETPTCTLNEGTGPYPSHGGCGGSIRF